MAARELITGGKALVNVFLAEPRDPDDPLVKAIQDTGTFVVEAATDADQGYRVLKTIAANADIIIDALLGTGAHLPIGGDLAKILRTVHQGLRLRHDDRPPTSISNLIAADSTASHDPIIVAVDVPTGLDADSGALDPNALYAHETITFEAVKPGLITFPGAEAVGTLHVVRLGLPDKLEARDSIGHTVVDSALVRDLLPKRPLDSNKGTFGRALIVAGSVNYIGAASLAGESAYRIGAGLVTIGAPQPIVTALATTLREATWILLPNDMGVLNRGAARAVREEIEKGRFTSLLVGPGLSQEQPTADFLQAFFDPDASAKRVVARAFGFAPAPAAASATPEASAPDFVPQTLPPLVVDADALNLLAKMENWPSRLPADSILTPHPGEMARLIGKSADGQETTIDSIQADRLNTAIEKAAAWHTVIVLKGAFTVIAGAGWSCCHPAICQSGTCARWDGRCAGRDDHRAARTRLVQLRRGSGRRVPTRLRGRTGRDPGQTSGQRIGK